MRAVLGQAALLRRISKASQDRLPGWASIGLVVLGPILAISTFLVLGPLELGASALALRVVLLADLAYVLVIAALVLHRVIKMIAARRARSAGSRLHLRLTWVFATVALVPAVMVAVFAGLTVNVGLEGWFSERVRNVVGASLAAAEAYEEEHRRDLSEDAQTLANILNSRRKSSFLMTDGDLRALLGQAQEAIQRGLKEAYVIDGTGQIRARGARSYLFDFEAPDAEALIAAQSGDVVIIEDWDNNEYRALVSLSAFVDRFLYVSRSVDGDILALLDETQETVHLYQQLEAERGRMLFEFALLYLGFAVILILAAIWLGLWFAERLSRPVGRLAGAAQRVGAGDLSVRVREEQGDDEIAMLGRIFNQMTRQLEVQRRNLLESNHRSEAQRRLMDNVLASVTAGVFGLDDQGRVEFINRSGRRMLAMDGFQPIQQPLAAVVPEFAPLLEELRLGKSEIAQQEIQLRRLSLHATMLVRMAIRRSEDAALEGFVVAFDDVSDLVSAQRMAAWGDVARRIAHEIKNPLTPIQLSAERLKRKFAREVSDPEKFTDLTQVIIRQTEDLRRIVDEFSKFARMPEPNASRQDLGKLVGEAVVLQSAGNPGVKLRRDLPEDEVVVDLDKTLMMQALTNLIKNAVEATETRREKGESFDPEVRVSLKTEAGGAILAIEDNGPGFPADRQRLFEPYVTTRDKGTGLGLPIVKKIVEEHSGQMHLLDAEEFEPGQSAGARVEIRLPLWRDEASVIETAAE